MELSAALAADLITLTEALDGADTDLAQTVQQLAGAASSAVGSYLGLTISATTGARLIQLTALQDCVKAADIRTSLRVPLEVAETHHAGTHHAGTHHAETHHAETHHAETHHGDTYDLNAQAEAITGPGMELILYAGTPGAFVDLAADLSWLTGRDLAEFVLDAHLVVAEHSDELVRTSWVNQAIGVLIGRGYTPEHAAHQIGLLPTRTWQDRRRSAEHVHTGLRGPDPQST